ncbi:MAG: Wzz/FepE/Etk N-terminal domain-containing protein [bacterium]
MKFKSQNELDTESKVQESFEIPPGWPAPYPNHQNGFYVEDEEINLIEYWRVLMKRKWIIVLIVIMTAISSVIFSLLMPNIYRAEVVLAPIEKKNGGGGFASLLGQFNGLASMVGLPLGNGSNEVNLAVLKSRAFIKQVVEENEMMPLLFPEKWDQEKNAWNVTIPDEKPTLWDAYRLLDGILSVSTDRKNGLTTVSLEREDPAQAASWLTLFIETLNNHLKEQAIKEAEANIDYLSKLIEETPLLEMRQSLYAVIAEQTRQIMLAKAQQYFAFKIIDPPEVPDKKFKPKRSMIVLLSTFVAAFMAIFLVFFMEYLDRQRQGDINEKL